MAIGESHYSSPVHCESVFIPRRGCRLPDSTHRWLSCWHRSSRNATIVDLSKLAGLVWAPLAVAGERL